MKQNRNEITFTKKIADILYNGYFHLICENATFYFYDPVNHSNIEIEHMQKMILLDMEKLI